MSAVVIQISCCAAPIRCDTFRKECDSDRLLKQRVLSLKTADLAGCPASVCLVEIAWLC
jgi:hypothetical protein